MNQPPYPPYAPPPPQGFAPNPGYGQNPGLSPAPAPYAGPPPGGYGIPGNGYAQPAPPAWSGGAATYGPQPAVGTGATGLRWLILASFLALGFFAVLGGALGDASSSPDDTMATLGSILMLVAFPAFIAYFVLVLVWIAKSWAMLPPTARMTQSGRYVTPGQAVGYLFVPFYNLYWYFVVSMGLCDALNRQLAAYGSPTRAPRGLAMGAAIVQVIPYVNLAFGPLLWLPYMFLTDAAKREYARLSTAQAVV